MAAASARSSKPVATPLATPLAALAGRLASFPVVTCDVFDTALFRCLARPEDVHLATGIRARAQGLIQHDPAAFHAWRQQAEHAAKQAAAAAGHDEPTMAEIYAHLVDYGVVADAAAAADLAALEFAVERQLNSANAALRTVLLARPAGQELVFVSDTQMPASQIATLLADAGYPSPTVFSSADARLSKHDGRLFPHVLAQLGRRADEVIHLGDNPHSDIAQAAAHGIATAWLPQPGRSPEPPPVAAADPLVRLLHSHRRSLAVRTNRAALPNAAEPNLAGYATGLFLGFTLFVLAEAKRRGLKRIYFMARDGHLPLLFAKRLAPILAPDVSLDYLIVSRSALAMTEHAAVTPDFIAALLQERAGEPLESLLGGIGITPEVTRGLLRAAGLDPAARLGREAPVAAVAGFLEGAAAQIDPQLLARREAALGYLEEVGFLAPGPRMVVDLGWRGSSQEILARIAGAPDEIFGCYLGLYPQALRRALNLRNANAYLFTFGAPQDLLEVVLDGFVVLELFFSAPDPTVLGYIKQDGRMAPLFAEEAEPGGSHRRAVMQQLEQDCLDELDAIGRMLGDTWPEAIDPRSAILAVTNLLTRPSRVEVEAINRIPFIQGVGGGASFGPIKPIPLHAWLQQPMQTLRRIERAPWRSGAARASLPWPLPNMTVAELQHRVRVLRRLLLRSRA